MNHLPVKWRRPRCVVQPERTANRPLSLRSLALDSRSPLRERRAIDRLDGEALGAVGAALSWFLDLG